VSDLGFIGLGMMGGRMVKRLLDAGHRVSGYNRTRAKAEPLVQAGMRWCDTPRAVAQAAEITFSMVTDSAALSSIVDGPDGVLAGLSAGKVYVDVSTVSPKLTRDIAGRVAAAGAHMLDAPVSGSIPAAEGGTLIFFVGGEADTLGRVMPILEKLGQKIVHVGVSGQGISMKVAINLNLPVQLQALFEGLLLAERSGIPREKALDALLSSVAASPAMKYRAPFILKMPDEVWFDVAMMHKDIQLALDLGQETGVPLRSAEMVLETLKQAEAMGLSKQDFAALFSVVAHQAGLQ
jgi:3-hydroxyisobutyrate dehydrogenase-like beta-hydroxyacid dehydrogenase